MLRCRGLWCLSPGNGGEGICILLIIMNQRSWLQFNPTVPGGRGGKQEDHYKPLSVLQEKKQHAILQLT